jgi:hypothetical protein
MHQQVKNVINRLTVANGQALFELSAGEQTPLGRILNRVYYRTDICDAIDREHRFGYPHNGGQHTFVFRGPWKEAVAVLELIKEVVADKFTLPDEESQLLSEFSYISQEIIARRKM